MSEAMTSGSFEPRQRGLTTPAARHQSLRMRHLFVAIAMTFLPLALPVAAEETPAPLRVAVFANPPFAQKDEDGVWRGLAVNLWQSVAEDAHLPFSFVETTADEAIEGTAKGRWDVLVGGVGVSAEREQLVDFTQPFLISPGAVAVPRNLAFPHSMAFVRDVLSHGVMSVVWTLAGSMIVFSLVLWLVERRANQDHFGGHPIRGLGSALWFAAVTLTTVGYGDKTPRTLTGRVIVFFWMFFGIFIVGVFTATLASSIAVARLQTSITRAADLAHYRNGVVEDSLAQNVLNDVGIPARVYPDINAGLAALEAGTINAFVDDEASLRYTANQDHPGSIVIDIIPSTHVSLAFATRPNLPEFQAINVALIRETSTDGWLKEIQRWLGPPLAR